MAICNIAITGLLSPVKLSLCSGGNFERMTPSVLHLLYTQMTYPPNKITLYAKSERNNNNSNNHDDDDDDNLLLSVQMMAVVIIIIIIMQQFGTVINFRLNC